jgi:hypothetical protein
MYTRAHAHVQAHKYTAMYVYTETQKIRINILQQAITTKQNRTQNAEQTKHAERVQVRHTHYTWPRSWRVEEKQHCVMIVNAQHMA